MGYTPAFDTIYTGTLYGKWPMAAVWASLIPLIDKHGQINLSFEAIAGMTGWPMELLQEGISQLEQPDPGSRTDAEEGRRIVRLDSKRPWGWRVVNHAIYREKARKQLHNERAVESGANKERLKTRRDQTRPDATGADRLSDSDANTDSNKRERTRARRATRVPEDFSPDLPLARSVLPDVDAETEAKKFRDWEFKTPRSDWAAAWRNWLQRCKERGEYARKSNGSALAEKYPGYKF